MAPLLVSYKGTRNGLPSEGWVVLNDIPLIKTGDDVENVLRKIADARGYNPMTMLMLTFQRLEGSKN